MKKYVNPQPVGGLDFRNEDWLSSLQEEQYNAIKAVIRGLIETNLTPPVVPPTAFVVSGCIITPTTPGNVTISAGYVYMNDDIIKFNGYSGPEDAWIVEGTPVYTQRIYKDGIAKNAIVEKTATVVNVAPVSGQSIDMSSGTPISIYTSLTNLILNDSTFITNITTAIGSQSIDHVSLTSAGPAGQPGATDTYTIWGDAGETINLGTFDVYNGTDGIDGGGIDNTAWTSGSIDNFTIIKDEDGVYTHVINASELRYKKIGKTLFVALYIDITIIVTTPPTSNEHLSFKFDIPGSNTAFVTSTHLFRGTFRHKGPWGGGTPTLLGASAGLAVNPAEPTKFYTENNITIFSGNGFPSSNNIITGEIYLEVQ